MKAAILAGYNKNGRELEIRDVPKPAPGAGEALVRASAAGVNPLDNMIVRGEVKLIVPYSFPLVMGNELVGTVEAVGDGVKQFAVGDRVYGRMPLAKIGAFAEYAAVAEGALAHVPDHLSDEKAACVPLTALTALQSLGLMGAKAGDSIFISGGTGSLGAMAVPIAVSMGLVVGGRDRCGQIACKEHRNWNSPAYEKKMFPQVNRNTPHIEKQYSPYRPEGPKTRLELTPSRWSGKTAGQGQYSPCRAKYSP
jgi:NADPH:quinone reductase-like Zn-dependent oxidoreductase